MMCCLLCSARRCRANRRHVVLRTNRNCHCVCNASLVFLISSGCLAVLFSIGHDVFVLWLNVAGICVLFHCQSLGRTPRQLWQAASDWRRCILHRATASSVEQWLLAVAAPHTARAQCICTHLTLHTPTGSNLLASSFRLLY